MSGWFPFQDVPGLLTPEMNANIRTRSLLGASAGLLNAAGWSDKPVSIFQALGQGVAGGLQGYEQGTNDAYKQSVMRENVLKLMESRKQADAWRQIFGGAVPSGSMPASAPAAAPQGLLTPVSAPASPGARPAVPSSQKVWGDTEAENAGLYDKPGATPVAPTGPVIPTQRDVRASLDRGLPATVAEMPAGMRQVIALAGPGKGMEILSQWVGKKAEKPSDSFLTVQSRDGALRPFRADSPELDRAVAAGGIIVTTPSSKGDKPANFVTLKMTDGTIKTFRQDDPQIDEFLANGAVETTKVSSNPNERTVKPDNYALPNGDTVLSQDGKTYIDPNDGQTKPMPSNAIKLGSEGAYTASRENTVRGRARAELDRNAPDRPPAELPTIKGTGLWSYLQSLSNDVAGGVGLDAAFGKTGVFRENEANRNYLLNLRQVAKTALVNNPRFPVAEQENVDAMFPDPGRMWRNPRTEIDKIPLLRNTLEEQLRMNNEAIAEGGLSKEEMSRLTSNNIETRRALRLLGEGDASLKVLGNSPEATQSRTSVPSVGRKPPPVTDFAARWESAAPGFRVHQGGKTYEKQSDGSAVEVP